jgi:HSP20 family protein
MTRMFDVIPFDMALRPLGSLWTRMSPFLAECENWVPPTDIAETSNAYIVTMEVPGIDMKELDVSYSDGLLNVKGEKIKETLEGECCHCVERFSGSFERSFPISGNVDRDKIDATYRDGVLKITLSKSAESVPKKIEVH